MAEKRVNRLVEDNEPSQKTEKGLEISAPKRSQFFGDLDNAATKESAFNAGADL